jgi:exosome complex component RRP4
MLGKKEKVFEDIIETELEKIEKDEIGTNEVKDEEKETRLITADETQPQETHEEYKNERKVVLPGERIVESMEYLPGRNCFRDGNSIYSKRLGVIYYRGRVIDVVPLSGKYMPEIDDMVIGTVDEVQYSGWIVNINSPYKAFLPLSGVRGFLDPSRTDLSKIYGIGDLIYAKVFDVTPMKDIKISMKDPSTRKFENGRAVKVSPVKVPRIIGKQGSMINMIKDKTGCRISVGQNGVVWLQGEKENLAARAIIEIEENSQIPGLTDHIAKFLSESK